MITVVTGPPCSGKTTYVKVNARPGDVTIDYDHLAMALGSRSHHEHSEAVRWVTYHARRAAIDEAINQHRRIGATVWIVHAYPTDNDMFLYRLAGARMVALTADAAELRRRATEAGRPEICFRHIDDWESGALRERRGSDRVAM